MVGVASTWPEGLGQIGKPGPGDLLVAAERMERSHWYSMLAWLWIGRMSGVLEVGSESGSAGSRDYRYRTK